MKQILLILVCDSCRCPYEFTRTAGEGAQAWEDRGDIIVEMALDDRWAVTEDGMIHYCPTCFLMFEKTFIMVNELLQDVKSN